MRIDLAELRRLRRARDRMDGDFASPLGVATLAQGAWMSEAHFIRRFRAAYGETPHAYLMTRRIERAKALLRAGSSVSDACAAVGCSSLGSFSSSFTALVGVPPSRYRQLGAAEAGGLSGCQAMRVTRPRRPAADPSRIREAVPARAG